eukprot:5459548-Pyramimonas_sp.AAC.1
MKERATAGSVEKMLQLSPLSLALSAPRNCPRRVAHVMAVDLRSPYSCTGGQLGKFQQQRGRPVCGARRGSQSLVRGNRLLQWSEVLASDMLDQ